MKADDNDGNMDVSREPQGNDGYRGWRMGIPSLGKNDMLLIQVPSFLKLIEKPLWCLSFFQVPVVSIKIQA